MYLDGVTNPQRPLAGVCAVAGLALLAGPGWALLAASVLLAVAPPSRRMTVAAVRVRQMAAAVWRWLLTGRQAVAGAAMPLAIVAVGAGLGLALGAGWGLAAAGLAVGGLSLAIDRTS